MTSPSQLRCKRDPAVCGAPEAVSHEGEAASGFAEQSVLGEMSPRQHQEAFVARALASRAKARRSGGYVEAKDVLAALESRLDAVRKG
ncbi:hypothetical protein [Xanthomonas tesorieronis]|uniref:hypothetical protein n=1 Tax=Xanthomonas tesorieronis TaxID=3160839 RepID=UPI0035195B54